MEVKVYKLDDYSWIATPWGLEETVAWYNKEYGDLSKEEMDDIIECDIDKEGVWDEITNVVDAETIENAKPMSGMSTPPQLGECRKRGGDVYKYISFREAVSQRGEFTEPFEVASTE